ncbi:MAG TPA: hypothetical protein VGE74_30000 [Gemmata sp.]
MDRWQIASALVILAAPTLIGGYDFIAYRVSGNAATISRLSLQTAWEYPPYQWCICFLFGLLCAHLFAPLAGPRPLPAGLSLILFVGVPYVVVTAAMITGLRTPDGPPLADASRAYPLLTVLLWLNLGAVVGSAFLPQSGS